MQKVFSTTGHRRGGRRWPVFRKQRFGTFRQHPLLTADIRPVGPKPVGSIRDESSPVRRRSPRGLRMEARREETAAVDDSFRRVREHELPCPGRGVPNPEVKTQLPKTAARTSSRAPPEAIARAIVFAIGSRFRCGFVNELSVPPHCGRLIRQLNGFEKFAHPRNVFHLH